MSPRELTFTADLDTAAPSSKIIAITPNHQGTAFPSITATGSAIVTKSSNACVGNSTSNLACSWDTGNAGAILVTVPVPDPNKLGAGTHTGSILIASQDYSVTVPVTYTVSPGIANVNQVTPFPVIEGVAGTATIRGSGFAHFGTTTPKVKFGTTNAIDVVVVNNSTLSVSYAPLAAGTYDISVTGANVAFTSTAKLVVTAPHAYTKTTLASTGQKLDLLYDATRQAIYIVKMDVVEKYGAGPMGWSTTPASLSVPGVGAIALSSDGQHLIAAGKNKFHDIDPVALTETKATEVVKTNVGTVQCGYVPCFNSAAMTSKGEVAAISSSQWQKIYFYDVATQTIVTSIDRFGAIDGNLNNASLSGSAHGNRILANQPGAPLLYNAAQNTLTLINVAVSAQRSLSSDGTTIASSTQVLKENGQGYAIQATLPQQPDALVVSPNGNLVYGYFITGNLLRPYDVSLAGSATAGTDIPLAGIPGPNAIMTISPDAKTVFIAGDNSIEIVPVQ